MAELEELRVKITTLHSSRAEALDEMITTDLFDEYEFGHSAQASSKLTDGS